MTAWAGSTRRATLPPNWAAIRRIVLERDGHRCVELMRNGSRCRDKANQVDHIGDPDDHTPGNLRSLCQWHHDRKSSQQGNAARTRLTSRRPAERHPGLL